MQIKQVMSDNNNAPGRLIFLRESVCSNLIFVLYNSQAKVHKRFELEYQWYWCIVVTKFDNGELYYRFETISAKWLNEYLRLK